jgi:hypothetical protein
MCSVARELDPTFRHQQQRTAPEMDAAVDEQKPITNRSSDEMVDPSSSINEISINKDANGSLHNGTLRQKRKSSKKDDDNKAFVSQLRLLCQVRLSISDQSITRFAQTSTFASHVFAQMTQSIIK